MCWNLRLSVMTGASPSNRGPEPRNSHRAAHFEVEQSLGLRAERRQVADDATIVDGVAELDETLGTADRAGRPVAESARPASGR